MLDNLLKTFLALFSVFHTPKGEKRAKVIRSLAERQAARKARRKE